MSLTLKEILGEYEQKKMKEEFDALRKKEELFKKYPKLQQIDSKIVTLTLSKAKELIKNNNKKVVESTDKEIKKLKEEKNNFLKELNISKDELEPVYECSTCKDTGYIRNEDFSVTMCHCLKQRLYNEQFNKANMANLESQNFDNFSDFLYSTEINEEKYHAKISPRENINLIKNICINFINNFDDKNHKNLLFTGGTGLGKTFLSSCIANEIIKKGKNVLYQTAPVMLDSILDYRFGKVKDSNIIENILNVDLLIIDDLGTESMNNIKFAELFNIINTRLLNQNNVTKTIISTNLSLNNLYKNYDERIVSRIIGNYDICYFFGEDIRFKKRNM